MTETVAETTAATVSAARVKIVIDQPVLEVLRMSPGPSRRATDSRSKGGRARWKTSMSDDDNDVKTARYAMSRRQVKAFGNARCSIYRVLLVPLDVPCSGTSREPSPRMLTRPVLANADPYLRVMAEEKTRWRPRNRRCWRVPGGRAPGPDCGRLGDRSGRRGGGARPARCRIRHRLLQRRHRHHPAHGRSQAGVAVPEDLGLIGMDNTPLSHVTDPPLTTVGYDLAAVAQWSTATALSALGVGEIHLSPTSTCA